jgi:hypothetical protein
MDWRLATNLTTQYLNGSVGKDLVGVHVGLRTTPRLEDDKGKVRVEPAGNDLVGSLCDGIGNRRVHPSHGLVVLGAALLHGGLGVNDGEGHLGLGPADGKVLNAALGLGAPQLARWDRQNTHAIGLGPSGQRCAGVAIVARHDADNDAR